MAPMNLPPLSATDYDVGDYLNQLNLVDDVRLVIDLTKLDCTLAIEELAQPIYPSISSLQG